MRKKRKINPLKWIGYLFTPIQKNGAFFVFMFALGWICTQMEIMPYYLRNKGAEPYELSMPELFLDIYVVCVLLMLIPQKVRIWVKALLYVFFYGLALVDMFCYERFESTLTPTMLMLAKVFLSSLLFGGGFSAMIYSLAGGVLSLIAMLTLCRVPKVGVLAVSAAGAVCHNLGQIIAASLMLGVGAVWAYFPVLVISGLVMGPLTGLVAKLVFRALKRSGGQQDINPKAFEDHRAVDVSVIGILLVLAVGAWLVMNHLGLHISDAQNASGHSGYYVEVVQNSSILYEIPVEEYGTYTIRNEDTGGENTFMIEKDGVHMEKANCPDKICIHQGTIREGDIVPVTCLPNRLSLQIISEKSVPDGFDLKKQDYGSAREK